MTLLLLPLAIAGVAFLYASVGHGGATGYLAVASLAGVSPLLARPGALWMNCVVAGIAFHRFHRAGLFDRHVFLPLACASVPCAWLGSRTQLPDFGQAAALAVALFAAGALLGWGRRQDDAAALRPVHLTTAVVAGGILGYLAGLTGIGGGVFLTPMLLLLRWTPVKTAGGVSALFIVVNSAAGLVGLGPRALVWEPLFAAALVAGIAGALLGTHLSVHRWRTVDFRRALAAVLWIAAGKLILTGH